MYRRLAIWLSLATLVFSKTDYTLVGTEFNQSSFTIQPYVSNGYIGQRIPVEGHGYSEIVPIGPQNGTNGWPLFDPRFTAALVAGFYDEQASTIGTNYPQTGGEQPISTIPTWSSLYVTVNGSTYGPGVDPSQVSNYSQSMSIQNGVVSTALTWTPPSSSPLQLNYTLFAHRNKPNLGVVHLTIDGIGESNLTVTDVLDGNGSWRTNLAGKGFYPGANNIAWTAVSPSGVPNIAAYVVSIFTSLDNSNYTFLDRSDASCYQGVSTNESTESRCYSVTPNSQGSATFVKFVGIASNDAYAEELQTAVNVSTLAVAQGYDSVLQEHITSWNELFDRADIVIDGDSEQDQELQLATRASLFHLLSNVRSGDPPYGPGDNSIAPAGLTSDSYAGQIFWDADIWMFPSLLALWPRYAQSIVKFRYKQLQQAQVNAQVNGRDGAIYPWTAGRYGNCTGVGPCIDYEYHLMNDIALAQYQYFASVNNKTWLQAEGWPVISQIVDFWESQVTFNQTLNKYTTLNETDPDEYANHVDNGAFTNAGINITMQHAIELASVLGITASANWSNIGNNIYLPVDPSSNLVLEYSGFNGTTEVKQADVVLLTYPLEYPLTESQALANLDYYALRTSPSGPGMTYSVFSIDASTLSQGIGCASWTYMFAASQPYSRKPFYQFSEQTNDVYNDNGGTNPAFTFLTGHGGFLQALTHGFTGYRTRLDAMYFDPILPPQFNGYTIKGFSYHGSRFDIKLTSNTMTITRQDGEEDIKVEIGPNNAKSGTYLISAGESLSFPVSSSTNKLIQGNLAQCQSLVNNTDISFTQQSSVVPGQYSMAAVDGSNSTLWQPSSNGTSSFTVNLGSSQSFKKLHFNWGEIPATSFQVSAGDSTSDLQPIASGSPTISVPYDPNTAILVRPIQGNTTDVTLNSTVTAQYVQVSISGSMMNDGSGATLAEFAVISQQ